MTHSPIPDFLLQDLISRALDEDLGGAGDVTSRAVIPDGTYYHAKLNARKAGVISGMQLARLSFHTVDPSLKVETRILGPCKSPKIPTYTPSSFAISLTLFALSM